MPSRVGRLQHFTNEKDELKEWRTHSQQQFVGATRFSPTPWSCMRRRRGPIKDDVLTPTQQQLSATLQARLISLTAKEAFTPHSQRSRRQRDRRAMG